ISLTDGAMIALSTVRARNSSSHAGERVTPIAYRLRGGGSTESAVHLACGMGINSRKRQQPDLQRLIPL
ncbi:MAG: hypothetical protein ABIS23_03720, partial [Sphingomicrobium sp.]